MEHALERAFHSGEACLIIRGESLDFDDITSRLDVELAGILGKVGKVAVGGRKVSKDFWMYRVKMRGDDPMGSIAQLLGELEPHLEFIRHLSDSGYDVCFRVSYRSELGQIYFEMPAELQTQLARFRLRLEFSILSYGGTV
jgi:hypothetical protein